jgi:XRE family aerobic/anaerobic benzoate catabolism transcriptional regulator
VRGQGDERPMAGNPDAMAELRNILTSREALYSRAEAHVDTAKATLEESLAAVIGAIDGHRFLAR